MSQEWMDRAERVFAKTYKRFPIVIEKGQGYRVWDTQGRAYFDFIAGIAVCSLGHAHPTVANALAEQAQKLVHVSNLYYTLPQIELAEWLVDNSFADRVFFCNSGAEANEAAIKMARKYFHDNGDPERFKVLSAEKSFHGRTMATLSATGQDKIRKGFDPVLEGFDFVPFNDIEALKSKIDASTCAVLLEPIQGEGGIRCPDSDYLKQVRQVCDETGTLLIFDEIQTGMGRTGKLFAHLHYGIEPDIMTLAKALANGLPIGAMLAKDKVAEAFTAGAHASTFGGTPTMTAAALATVKILAGEKIVEHCREMGVYFTSRLEGLAAKHKAIVDVRGKGLLLGMKLAIDAAPIVDACLGKGFLINGPQPQVLRFAPPLIIEKEPIDALVSCLDEIFSS